MKEFSKSPYLNLLLAQTAIYSKGFSEWSVIVGHKWHTFHNDSCAHGGLLGHIFT